MGGFSYKKKRNKMFGIIYKRFKLSDLNLGRLRSSSLFTQEHFFPET